MDRETRFWTVIGILVAVVSAWIGYEQWILAAKPPGQYVRLSNQSNIPDPKLSDNSAIGNSIAATEQKPEAKQYNFDKLSYIQIEVFYCSRYSTRIEETGKNYRDAEKLRSALQIETNIPVEFFPLNDLTRSENRNLWLITENAVIYDKGEFEEAKQLARFSSIHTGKLFLVHPNDVSKPSSGRLTALVCDL